MSVLADRDIRDGARGRGASGSTRTTRPTSSRRPWTCTSTAASACSATTATRSSTRGRRSRTSPSCCPIADDEPFILHPGEFVLGPDPGVGRAAGRPRGPARGEELAGPPGPAHPLDGRLRGPGLEGHADAGAVQRRQPADRALLRHAHRPDQLLPDELAGGAAVRFRRSWAPSTRASPSPPRRRSTRTSSADARSAKGAEPWPSTTPCHWSADLGGGTRVALIQAGTFKSDAGTLLGPVPWVLWRPWAEGELDENRRLTQALNCLLVETPAGRVLIETGIGERMDEKNTAMRGYEGAPIVPALREAGFDPGTVDVVAMSHLHYDHAGGLLLADGSKAFPRATIVAQRAEWEIALERQRARRGLVRPAGAAARGGLGRGGLGRGRPGAAAGRVGRPDRRALRGPPGGRRARGRAWRTVAGLLRRPVHAAVVRQPALGDGVRRLPARLAWRSRASCSGAPSRTTGPSCCPTRRGCRSASWCPTGTASGSRGCRPRARAGSTPRSARVRARPVRAPARSPPHLACVARMVVIGACAVVASGACRWRLSAPERPFRRRTGSHHARSRHMSWEFLPTTHARARPVGTSDPGRTASNSRGCRPRDSAPCHPGHRALWGRARICTYRRRSPLGQSQTDTDASRGRRSAATGAPQLASAGSGLGRLGQPALEPARRALAIERPVDHAEDSAVRSDEHLRRQGVDAVQVEDVR